MKNKSIKKLYKLIFSYKTIGAIFLLLQLIFVAACLIWLQEYYPYIRSVTAVASIVFVVYELNREVNNSFKISWLILVIFAPIAGMLLYLFMRTNLLNKNIAKCVKSSIDSTKIYLKQDQGIIDKIKEQDRAISGISNYLYKTAGYPTYTNNDAKYFSCGEDLYDTFISELKKAKKFIFMEYFIISSGEFWDSVLDTLKVKVSEGVEIKLMFDGMGCLTQFDRSYPGYLKQFGIECKIFAPVVPFLSSYQNNRDHRKITVIDGTTAFTGGINISDEYINKIERFGYWKDNTIMIKGSAVRGFTAMFLQMWDLNPQYRMDNYDKYFGCNYKLIEEEGYIIPYGDNPIDNEPIGRNVYLEIINSANEYVHIMTPYLVPDSETIEALKFAAKRGVDVKILMPGIPDKWYAFILAKTFYPELINSGVKIYEFIPGFLHSKTMVSDNIKAVVGTINQDYRSMYLHYECGAYLYGSKCIKDIEKDFDDTLKKSTKMFIENYKNLPLYTRICGRFLRIFASMM